VKHTSCEAPHYVVFSPSTQFSDTPNLYSFVSVRGCVSHPYKTKSRMHGAMPPPPSTPSWHGAQLKHRDNFTFTKQLVKL